MLTCPNCGSPQPEGAAFCDQCGTALGGIAPGGPSPGVPVGMPPATPMRAAGEATICPHCGASNIPGEAFCQNCGAPLGGLGVAAPPAPGPAVSPAPPGAPFGAPSAPVAPPPAVGGMNCPQCGAPLEPGSAFCDMCGASVSSVQPAPFPPPTFPATPSVTPPVPTPSAPSIYPPSVAVPGRLIVQGTNAVLQFPPGKSEILIGREDPVSNVFPEIDLTDHGGDEGGVSRRHARIFVRGNQVFIEDLNSTNYTFVNQQKLAPGQPHPLNNGDEVRLGKVRLTYVNP